MHTPPLYRAQASVCECAAIAYSAQPPPTVGEIEGAKEGEGIPQTQKRSPVQTFT